MLFVIIIGILFILCIYAACVNSGVVDRLEEKYWNDKLNNGGMT